MEFVMRFVPVFLLCCFTCVAPLCAQDAKPDIPDPECDGSTQQMVECMADATEKWDKRLNEAYREALADATSKQQREQLRKAQRLWVQFRDANCMYYALGEGTISRLDSASCMFDMTKSRAVELERGTGN
jgi:uncharacterized protein YecT (DUF1311 family)